MATSSTGTRDTDKEVMSQSKGNSSIDLIKEKMKERRRKKVQNDSNTSWSRSFSKRKGTASFILKASLRSNNKSLAKALAASKHEAQQAHHNLLELQRERQFLLHQANSKRMAEKECIQRFGNIKQVLSKVTHSLLDAVSSLGLAIDLCSSVPLRESSLGLVPRASMTSDDDSFRIVQKADQGQAKLSSAIESAASHVMQAADTIVTAASNQSEPTSVLQSRKGQAQGTSTVESEQVCDSVSQPAASLSAADVSDKLEDLVNEELDFEFPSLDDLDVHLRFIDETPDSKVGDGSHPRRQSSRLEPPVKRSRTATLLDPVAIQKALAEDADYTIYTEDPDEHNQTILSPEPEKGLQQTRSKSFKDPSPSTNSNNHTVKRAVESRRATFNVSPVKPEAAVNKTFEVSGSPKAQTPGVHDQQTTGVVKERYVFIHTPPGNVSSYKTLDMELTGVTNNSSSAQDELNQSLANKSRFNHDEQVIRPWGNIHMDKAKKSPAARVQMPKHKSKPPTNTSKSLLPKPQKKSSKECSKMHKNKGIKKISSKKATKKTCLVSESIRSDLAVFDLSAGDSFSLAAPVFPHVKSKTTDTLAGFIETSTDQEAGVCFENEKATEDPITLQCSKPLPHEEQHLPISDSKPNTDLDAETHVDKKSVEAPIIYQCPQPMPQKEQCKPRQQEKLLDSIQLEEPSQAESLKPVESVITNRGSKIKRMSKKAKSVVSPDMDKMPEAARKMKPSEANDTIEGTCLAKIRHPQQTASWQPAEDVNDADPALSSHRHTKRRPTKDKKDKKGKASAPPHTEIFIEDTKPASVPTQHPHKTRTTNQAEPSVHFNLPSPEQVATMPLSTFQEDKEGRCSPPVLVNKNKSQASVSTNPPPDKSAASSRLGRGQKRMADVLKEEEPTAGMGEDGAGSQEIGRRSRRAGHVSYKEPSLKDKMRREHNLNCGTKAAKKKKVKRNKRTALETVTNVT